MGKGVWVWYYGDFEIYHNLKLHIKRQKYDCIFPAFWRLDDCWHSVRFRKEVELDKEETIRLAANGVGHIEFNGSKRALNEYITIPKGNHLITVCVANIEGLPSLYIEGETIFSDGNWKVDCYDNNWINAGFNNFYTDISDNPEIFKFEYSEIFPVSKEKKGEGVLYDFGSETFAKICLSNIKGDISIYYGESMEEALDTENCYLREHICNTADTKELVCRAFRYLYITGEQNFEMNVYYEYLPMVQKGNFKCSDELINKIWNVSEHTFTLNSREFYLDGIKRDRWVWSGDAYQSYLINRYIYFDLDIIKRTIISLRGKNPIGTHINTIVDYSLYWIISIFDYYEMSGDVEFIKNIYTMLKTMMDYCLERTDDNGFIVGKESDWVFIDWADIDKCGAVCAEQILLWKSLKTISKCCELLNIDNELYKRETEKLFVNINKYFWNDEKGAFIDSFESKKNHISRHSNIFALLYDFANKEQKNSIYKNVITNDDIAQINTPYFKFYEIEARCMVGDFESVTDTIRFYWGKMLDFGATSFWEEYNSEKPREEQYSMYSDKFGKSLCHAWGASPIYILGKYYLGVIPTSCGYDTFEVKPHLGGLDWIEGTVPVNGGTVSVKLSKNSIEVLTDKDGGTLVYENETYKLEKDVLFKKIFV